MLTNIWNVFVQSPLWMKVVIVAALSIGITWEFSQMFSIGSTTKNVLIKAVRKAGSMQNLDSAVERFMRSEGYGLANAAVLANNKKMYKAADITVRAGGVIGLVGVAGTIYNGTKFAQSVVDMCTVENCKIDVTAFMNGDVD